VTVTWLCLKPSSNTASFYTKIKVLHRLVEPARHSCPSLVMWEWQVLFLFLPVLPGWSHTGENG